MEHYKIVKACSCGRIVYEIRRLQRGLWRGENFWCFIEQHTTIKKAEQRVKELKRSSQ